MPHSSGVEQPSIYHFLLNNCCNCCRPRCKTLRIMRSTIHFRCNRTQILLIPVYLFVNFAIADHKGTTHDLALGQESVGVSQIHAVSIDPSDPHRLYWKNETFYPVGYYPCIDCFIHQRNPAQQQAFWQAMLDQQERFGINYMRQVFTMGQPAGASLLPYELTGPGLMADGTRGRKMCYCIGILWNISVVCASRQSTELYSDLEYWIPPLKYRSKASANVNSDCAPLYNCVAFELQVSHLVLI